MFEIKPTNFTVIVTSEIWDSHFVTMTFRHHLPAELRWKAIGRLEAGQSQTDVVRWLNVSPSVVYRLWRKFQTTHSASRRFSVGRPLAATRVDHRYLTLCARKNRTTTPTLLRFSLLQPPEGWCLRQLCARRPAICVPLTSRPKRNLLERARQRVHWTPDQWWADLFTDESRLV